MFLVMTRDTIETLLPPDLDLDECGEGSCPVEMGRSVQARWLVVSELNSLGRGFGANLSLYDVESGALVNSEVFKVNREDLLEKLIPQRVISLLEALQSITSKPLWKTYGRSCQRWIKSRLEPEPEPEPEHHIELQV
jgi:hypothetical protein